MSILADASKGIDVGVVVRDADAALRFYGDTLDLEHVAEVQTLSGTMHRFACGSSVLKVVVPAELPDDRNPPRGFLGATGVRYFTLTVADLDSVVDRCTQAGRAVAVPRTDVRPGVVIAVVEDPDGNWVELLQG